MKKPRTKKSNHKHIYEECLLRYTRKNKFTGKDELKHIRAKKCTVCNKISDVIYFETEKITDESGRQAYRMLDDEETLAKFKHLPIYDVTRDDNIFLI